MAGEKYVAYVSTYTMGDKHGIRVYDVDMENGSFTEKDKVEITKIFRGCKLNVTIENPNGKQSGVTECIVNGTAVSGCYISDSLLMPVTDIVVRL